jgi:acyl dehydratase
LGTSAWMTVDQQRITAFADATEDHQWIHVDPQRAAAGPFGTTIAHGFLTLSVLPYLIFQTYQVEGAAMTINYGLNKVRFPAPVPVGSRVRAEVMLAEASEVSGGLQLVVRATMQIDGVEKPGCVADWVTRVYF